jgi:hypothetical protein
MKTKATNENQNLIRVLNLFSRTLSVYIRVYPWQIALSLYSCISWLTNIPECAANENDFNVNFVKEAGAILLPDWDECATKGPSCET